MRLPIVLPTLFAILCASLINAEDSLYWPRGSGASKCLGGGGICGSLQTISHPSTSPARSTVDPHSLPHTPTHPHTPPHPAVFQPSPHPTPPHASSPQSRPSHVSSFNTRPHSSGFSGSTTSGSPQHGFIHHTSSGESLGSISSMSSLPPHHHSAAGSPSGSPVVSPTAVAIQRFIHGGGAHPTANRPLRIGSPVRGSGWSSSSTSTSGSGSPTGKGKAHAQIQGPRKSTSSSGSISSPGRKFDVGAGTSRGKGKMN